MLSSWDIKKRKYWDESHLRPPIFLHCSPQISSEKPSLPSTLFHYFFFCAFLSTFLSALLFTFSPLTLHTLTLYLTLVLYLSVPLSFSFPSSFASYLHSLPPLLPPFFISCPHFHNLSLHLLFPSLPDYASLQVLQYLCLLAALPRSKSWSHPA